MSPLTSLFTGVPTASKHTVKSTLELPSRTGYQGTANRGRGTSIASPSTRGTRGRGHLRSSGLSRSLGHGLGRGSGGGEKIAGFTTSRTQTNHRGKGRSLADSLLEAGANNSNNKQLGHFKTASMVRKAQLAGRGLADRVDFESVGPLTDLSGIRPIPKRPRPEGQRKTSELASSHEQKQSTPESINLTSPTEAMIEDRSAIFLDDNDQLAPASKSTKQVKEMPSGEMGIPPEDKRTQRKRSFSESLGVGTDFAPNLGSLESKDLVNNVNANAEYALTQGAQIGSLSSIGSSLVSTSKALNDHPVKAFAKVRFNDYKVRQTHNGHGDGILVKAQFGDNSSEIVSIAFKNIDKSSQEPWVQTLRNLDTIVFDRVCINQDFRSQLFFIQKRILADGSLLTDSSGMAILDEVASYLRPILGLLFNHRAFSILLFPAKCEDWKFIESPSYSDINTMLRYRVFESDRDLMSQSRDPSAEITKSSLDLKRPYLESLVGLAQGLRYKNMFPMQKGGHKSHSFYLMFPLKSTSYVSFLITWLQECDPDCRIFVSQKEGSWNAFMGVSTGTIIIHESLVPQIFKLPNLAGLLTGKAGSAVWCVGGSLSPQLNLMAVDSNAIENGPALLRLFPHGGAVFLTPSFLIEEPQRTFELLKWFQSKISKASYGSWKLVTCYDVRCYLLNLAIQKASERDNLLSSLPFEVKDKEAIAAGKGLSHKECDYRFHSYGIVEKLRWNEDVSDQNDCSIIYADESIDQGDEKSLVDWFAGWTMLKLSLFRRFVVVGTTTPHTDARTVVDVQSLSADTSHSHPNVHFPDALDSKKDTNLTVPRTIPEISNTRDASPRSRPRLSANVLTENNDSTDCHDMSSKFSQSTLVTDHLNVSKTASSTLELSVTQALGGVDQGEEVAIHTGKENLDNPKQAGHGIDKTTDKKILSFIALTGEGRKTAEDFLAGNNNDLQQAARQYISWKSGGTDVDGTLNRDDPLDPRTVLDFTAANATPSEEQHQHFNPSIMDYDARRAIEIYESSLRHGRPPTPLKGNGNSSIAPPLSGTSVETEGIDQDFVSRSVLPPESARPQLSTQPRYDSPGSNSIIKSRKELDQVQTNKTNDIQGANSTSRSSTRIQLPVGSSRESVPDPEAYAVNGNVPNAALKSPDQIREGTMEWYRKIRANGQGWEHIYVNGSEECFKLLGIKSK
jgi:chromo domain-containing protein 1